MVATRKIIAISRNSVIKKIQLKALMKMHETCTVATLLTNCEGWVLNKGEREKLQKIELWALKKILNIPITTPTPAIWFLTGLIMTPIQIDKRQLIYLKTILDRPTEDWTRKMLHILRNLGTGWASQIDKKLEEYNLERSWQKISQQPKATWKNAVIAATEQKNKEELIDMCCTVKGEKTKTKFVLDALRDTKYERKTHNAILNRDGLKSRAQIMAMCGMLDCGKNYKFGYGGTTCRTCDAVDDENHRINECCKFKERNLYESEIKYDFDTIYSNEEESVIRTIEVIMLLWNLENGQNVMK